MEPRVSHTGPSPSHEFAELSGPLMAQVKTSRLPESLKAPAGIHAQTESSGFAGASQRRKLLLRFNGPGAALQLLAVKRRIRPVFCAHARDVTGSARAESVIAAAFPVVNIVLAGKGRRVFQGRTALLCEIGDFVLLEIGGSGRSQEMVVHRAIQIFIYRKFSGLKL